MTDSTSYNKFFCSIKQQINHIREGGLLVLLWKFYLLWLLVLAVPIVLVIRLLRPFIIIRFGQLRSRRVGHFSGDTEIYLCQRDLHIHDRGTYDIFYHQKPICNYQLKKMLNRILHVCHFTNLVRLVDMLSGLLPGAKLHIIPMPSNRDINGLLRKTQTHLWFNPKEERMGLESLLKLGAPESVSFVCFNARDSAYLDTVYPHYNWRNHEYRNSNIYNYIPAAEELTDRRYFVIRMGAIVKDVLQTTNPMIIDYATKYRTDFLDIYLSAKCKFFIASGTGIDEVPAVFRRPIVYVNYIPIEYVHTWYPTYLFITKKLWLRKESRFLSFREILDSGIGRFGKEEYERYEKLGIDIIENTPQEIKDVVIEMDERLKGTWKTTAEDEELQNRFRYIFKKSKLHGEITARIGAEFLRGNRQLLN